MAQAPSVSLRWRDRFENFARAYRLLREAVEMAEERPLSTLEKEGLVQRFEYTWELAWKVLRDYLAAEGIVLSTVTPRSVLRAAFAAGVIADGDTWLAALDARNKMAHVYSQEAFEKVVQEIRDRYLAVLDGLHMTLLERRSADAAGA